MNFNYITSEKYHNVYHLYEDVIKEKLTDLLEIQFVELTKFLKAKPELNNNLDRWLTYLIDQSKEEISMAELRMKQILDEKSMLEGAREEGKIENATEMILDVEPIEKIMKYSKLTEKEIVDLKHKIFY